MIIFGEPGPYEDTVRRDNEFRIVLFNGRVLNTDIHRPRGQNFDDGALAPDLIENDFVVDDERFEE